MHEGLISVLIVALVVAVIEAANFIIHCLMSKAQSASADVFAVIPLDSDRHNSEYVLREFMGKISDADLHMKIYVLNMGADETELEICRKLRDDIGGFEIVNCINDICVNEKFEISKS